MHDEVFIKIGKNIKKYRELKGLTQEQLADKVNKGINFIGKIEIAFSRPSLYTLIDIANVLDIKLSDLVNLE